MLVYIMTINKNGKEIREFYYVCRLCIAFLKKNDSGTTSNYMRHYNLDRDENRAPHLVFYKSLK